MHVWILLHGSVDERNLTVCDVFEDRASAERRRVKMVESYGERLWRYEIQERRIRARDEDIRGVPA